MNTALRAMVGVVLGLALAGSATAGDKPIEGTWKKHEITFSFTGFTTHYSCGGFEDKLDLLLAAAGARPDAKVVASCLAPMGGPERISMARVSFHALEPLGAGAAASTAVPAQWKSVHLRARAPRDLGEGDCELVEQFARRILPMFTVRDVEDHMSCVPHQVSLGSVNLKFRVLAPAPKPHANAPR